jgi:hypothetical protein
MSYRLSLSDQHITAQCFFFVQAKAEGLLANEYSIELYQRVGDCYGWKGRITTLGGFTQAFFGHAVTRVVLFKLIP